MTSETRSLSARLDSLPVARWHAVFATICCLGLMFDAFDGGLLSSFLPLLIKEWHLTSVQTGVLGSSIYVGMLIGALFFGTVADMIGRWKTFQITILIYALGTGLRALAPDFLTLFAVSVVVGFGTGGLIPVDSSYLSEFMPARIRGRILAWFNAMFPVGIGLAYAVTLFIAVPYGWRYGFLVGIIPAFLLFVTRRGGAFPESARYLEMKGRAQEAVKVVEGVEQRVLKKVTVPTADAVKAEQAAGGAVKRRISMTGLFANSSILKITAVTSILWFAFQFGSYGLSTWLAVLFVTELHFSLASGLAALGITLTLGVFGQFSAGFACDYLGRRPTLAYSLILFGASYYLLFLLGMNPLLAIVLQTCASIFTASSNGVLYAYTPELFPSEMRAAGVGFASAMGRLASILGPIFIGLMYAAHFGIVSIMTVIVAVLLVGVATLAIAPETRRKTLEEIASLTRGKQ